MSDKEIAYQLTKLAIENNCTTTSVIEVYNEYLESIRKANQN